MDENVPVVWMPRELLSDFKFWLGSRNLQLVKYPPALQENTDTTTEYFVTLKGE